MLNAPVSEIVPRLFLGSVADASRGKGTYDAVVNCTPDFPFYGDPAYRMRVSVLDNHPQNDSLAPATLMDAVHFVSDHLDAGRVVLVHCVAGQQRSPSVVAAYLIEHFCLSIDEAVQFVRMRRPSAFFESVNFRPSLEAFMASG